MRSSFFFLVALLLAVPGCGNGNIGDVFAIFPPEAFEGGGGDGDDGDVPGAPFVPSDIGGLAGGQGVSGEVRNIVVAAVGARTYAFLAAGIDGIHVVDMTEPDLVNANSYVTTVNSSTLTAPAALAGGAVHDLTIVDNTFLVCIGVGTGAANAVTVFNIVTLIGAATSSSADLSAAFVAPAGAGDEIAVPGDLGRGGGVSGASGTFVVATGGTAIMSAVITSGMPPTWSLAPVQFPDLSAIGVANVTDVLASQFAVYASGRGVGGTFGYIVLNPLAATNPTFTAVDGVFTGLLDQFVTGPGNYPLDLAVDTLSLYVSGEDELQVFNLTNPLVPTGPVARVGPTGLDTISVAAQNGTFVVGADDFLRIGANVLGQARITGSVTFQTTFTIRGMALHSTDRGSFALCCAGTGGLRVVQLTQTQP